ncbi:MAG: TolC family protein [Candidatus Binataceae bacterium]
MMANHALRITIAAVAAFFFAELGCAAAAPLTLADAIDRALAFAPSVSMASADSDVSAARAREQRAPLYPDVTAGTEYYQAPGYNPIITNAGLSTALLALNYTAWDWGRRQAQYRAARYVSEAARLGVAAARAQIAFDTSVAYYDLMRAHQTERELSRNLDRLSRYVATVESLQATGIAITNDVLKMRSARDSGELALSSARSATRRAVANLGSLIGQFDQADIEVVDITDTPGLPNGDIAQTPALQAASRAISSAKLQVQAAEAARLPTFQIALTSGFLGVNPTATINHSYGASYDGVVSMPVFDGGAISSRIDQAKAKQNGAEAQFRQTQYLLERRLKDASVRYDEARDALAILARAQPIADDAFALTWTRFLGGGGATLLEVLDSYERSEQLRIEYLNHQFAAREAAAETALLYGQTR